MRHFNARSLILVAGLLVTLQAALAQQPTMPNPSSDALLNTEYGTGSLLNLSDTANPQPVQNSALGAGALNANVSGTGNTGVGYQASYSNTSGNYNTPIGGASLWGNNSGSENSAIGYQALENQIGSYNSGFGYSALLGPTG